MAITAKLHGEKPLAAKLSGNGVIVTIPGEDGKDGVGIASLVQTTVSDEEGGTNVITATLTDGTTSTFEIMNGSKGPAGTTGVSATHSWNGTVLTMTSASGTSSMDLKGDPGEPGQPGKDGEPGKDGTMSFEELTDEQKATLVGERGNCVLNITTAPSSYSTTTGGFKPTYRVALSTVLSQSKATKVLVGDTVLQSYYTYPVGYVDSSYVYLGTRVSIRGAQGAKGNTGDTGAAGADGYTPVRGTDYWTPEDIATIEGYIDAQVSQSGGGGGGGIFTEDTQYPGCFYRMVDGEKEWLNPPMVLETAYRTTERYEGKPVWVGINDYGAVGRLGGGFGIAFFNIDEVYFNYFAELVEVYPYFSDGWSTAPYYHPTDMNSTEGDPNEFYQTVDGGGFTQLNFNTDYNDSSYYGLNFYCRFKFTYEPEDFEP